MFPPNKAKAILKQFMLITSRIGLIDALLVGICSDTDKSYYFPLIRPTL